MSKVFLKKWLLKKKKEEVDKEQRETNLIIYWAKERNKNKMKTKKLFDAHCNDILGIGPVKTKNIIRLEWVSD